MLEDVEKPDWLMSRNDMLKKYQTFPGDLAEELDYIFGTAGGDKDVAVHNYISGKISRLCPDRNRLLKNVAQAIINTAIHEGAPDG